MNATTCRLGIDPNSLFAECYENSVANDEIERSIAATLPVIIALTDALSAQERVDILSTTATSTRHAFNARYGTDFGCEPELPVQVAAVSRIDRFEIVSA